MGIFEGLAGRPGPLCTEVSRSKEKRGSAGCSDEIEDDLGLLPHFTAVGGLHGCCLWTKSYPGSQFCHSALLAFGRCREQDAELLLPENPDEPFFRYVRGNRKNLLDPSEKTLVSYFGRLLSYIVKGEFVDEDGVKHTGGPAYSRFNRKNGHVWELFNEAEHSYTVDQCPGRINFLRFLFLLDFYVVSEGHSCKPNFSGKPNDDVEVHP